MWTEIFNEIKKFDRVIIHRHFNPDGDAIGSQVGLKHILKDAFPEKEILAVGDDAGRYSFICDSVMDEVSDDKFEDAVSIILDCGSAHLISDERYKSARETIRIDHHSFSGKFADFEYIDSDAESCCGEIARMAMDLDLKVSPVAASALFTGMVTDSGRFRYDSTTPQTFREAAFLLEQGIDTNDIYLNLYADDFSMKQLRAKFILKIQRTEKNVAYIFTSKEELESLNADTFSISRGMVNTMAEIKGIDIWANFTETEEGILCELRSSRKSVVDIAKKYGGGGHDKACGATLKSRDEMFAMISDLDARMEE